MNTEHEQGTTQEADRRAKLQRLRDEFKTDGYGQRTENLISLADARNLYDADADAAHKENKEDDQRPTAKIVGRIRLHRVMGNLIFITLGDDTGDLQIAVSKRAVGPNTFKQAKLADLSDIIIANGPLGMTKTGEITIWCDGEQGYQLACKSLLPPPAKWEGLTDKGVRYKKRYIDLHTNPDVMATFLTRSKIIKNIRDFFTNPPKHLGQGFLEVETPMMQAIPGGAAARPFVTHLNAMDMALYMRISPELYLKRLLVGGMPRVFEINRNFRNEGMDRAHNPEFTMLELYQAFGDYNSMMQLTETLINTLAKDIHNTEKLPYGDIELDYALPFRRAKYLDLFEEHNSFHTSDHEKLVEKAQSLEIETRGKDHDIILNDVWEQTVEHHLVQPTFVIDYPASLCPLTRRKADDPTIAERFELFIANMELANAYTELNDPDIQEANFKQQIAGLDDDESTFRNMDSDFIEALKIGMPPAGGLGIGIDRLVMLLTNSHSIRDVILFPMTRQ